MAKTDPHQILKLIVSKNENERISAANRLFEACERKEWHPDDWRPQKNGRTERLPPAAEAMWQAKLATVERARQIAEIKLESAQELAQRVKERAEREHKAREKAEADVEKLKEQLNKAKAKAKPGPTRTVDLLSSLLPGGVLDALSADEVADKITALQREKGNRKHNETAQVDLLLGQLTKRLHDIWDEMFGPGSETPRKRGDSNTPTVTQFVQQYAGKSASWCQRCLSAFEHVFSEEWPEIEVRLDGSVSIENILKAARDPNRPMVRRISKVQKRLDALTEAVRRRAIDEAVDLIETWESEVQQKQA